MEILFGILLVLISAVVGSAFSWALARGLLEVLDRAAPRAVPAPAYAPTRDQPLAPGMPVIVDEL